MTDTGLPTGVVVMAYGTPESHEDIPAYYTHIRRGRPPSEEQLADLVHRYDALGGISRLRERTEAQRTRLAAALDALSPGRYRVVIGQRHAAPFIADAVQSLTRPANLSRPCERIIGVVLAPHYSAYSVGHYSSELAEAAASHGATAFTIPHWYELPAVTSFLAAAVRDALATIDSPAAATRVVFTAHSLPERLLVDDPYPDQLLAAATSVAHAVGLGSGGSWSVAWQSAGATNDEWRGPDINDVIRDLAATDGVDGVVVCPHGFTSDHLEVAYDLDIQAQHVADESGIAFARTRVINDDPSVFNALAEWVHLTAGTP